MEHPLHQHDRLLDNRSNRVIEITAVWASPPGPYDPPAQSHYYEAITVSQPDKPKRVGTRGAFDNITADRRYTKVSK